MANNNPVRIDELLYRRIRDNEDHIRRHFYDEQGQLEINPQCFYDKKRKPSVFRAKLMNFNARPCKIDITDGVVGFTAGNVRSIEIEGYKVEVFADPEDIANCKHNSDEYFRKKAHAIICITRINNDACFTEKQAFRGLLQALSTISKPNDWILPPHF